MINFTKVPDMMPPEMPTGKNPKFYHAYTGSFFDDIRMAPQSEKWGILRQYYMEELPRIFSYGKKDLCQWIDLGDMDWQRLFSPIESIAWDIIKTRPGIVLYPQFPVFNHFIDFANPVLRIGLELDGKDFHDRETDLARDQMLHKYGWKIFRASGSLSNRDTEFGEGVNPPDYKEEDFDNGIFNEDYGQWMMSTLTGLIEAISIYYFRKPHDERINDIIMFTLESASLTGAAGLERFHLNRPF